MDIKQKIESSLTSTHCEWVDESYMHGSVASHFKLTVVSPDFSKLSRVERHRKVQAILKGVEVHALSLHLYTPEEWEKRGGPPPSPSCSRSGPRLPSI